MLREAGGKLPSREIKARLAESFNAEPWAAEIIESNGFPRWENYLLFFSIDSVKAGWIEKTDGIWTLTPAGVEASHLAPREFLDRGTEAYQRWRKQRREQQFEATGTAPSDASDPELAVESEQGPPEERMLEIQRDAHLLLADELLQRLKAMSWQGFERAVVQVLLGMGYGGSRKEAGQALQRAGDEGIDGFINEDRLGLDVIYVQAKKWADASVGRPEIQKFVGALAGKQASKGIFITTSRYTDDARDYAQRLRERVILIDGSRLAELMIEFNVGAFSAVAFELKKINLDFFNES
ncbi:MAG: restriction endonuclease [Burkholderiales bacterium]|nr:restriction endonuclease [Burkholderiales bacterium]